MLILIVAYIGGVLTILSPCILPILPFVFARADRPFLKHGLPLLVGMAFAFAGVASLAAVGGGWVVSLNEYGRYLALALLATFGITMLFPAVADRMSRPLVAIGMKLSRPDSANDRTAPPVLSALVLGAVTGLLWAPCAGPILGLILTTAALNGASAGTSLLLLSYAAGACTSLGAALLFGGRLASAMKSLLPAGEWMRRAMGAAVLAGVSAIALGLDTRVLSQIRFDGTTALEEALVRDIRPPDMQAGVENDGNAVRQVTGALLTQAAAPSKPPSRTLRVQGSFPPLSGAGEWINSSPLTPEGLRGKVVLVDFWTYSCINCLRTLPYLRAWHEKYQAAGLVIVGVHTPEFAFEKKPANVRKAVADLGIAFPVAIDNDFGVWRAFGNQYWPAFYFIDAQGRIRHHQFGEGQYDTSEQVIQQLLSEAGQAVVPLGFVSARGEGVQAAGGTSFGISPEAYLGSERSHNFASPGGLRQGVSNDYKPAKALRLNQWDLTGLWTVERERVVSNQGRDRLSLRFHARDVHLVLGPSVDGQSIRFRVLVDGKPPLGARGVDVDAQGHGTIEAQRLYQLVRQQGGASSHLLEIEFLEPGAQAYAFTFG